MNVRVILRVAAVITGLHAVVLLVTAGGWLWRAVVEKSLGHGGVIMMIAIAALFGAGLLWCTYGLLKGSSRFVGPALFWQFLAILTAIAWWQYEANVWAGVVIGTSIIGIVALLSARAHLNQVDAEPPQVPKRPG